MFRPLRLALAVAFSIVIASPSAYANKWLAWLEELSGPGAFESKLRWGVEAGCLSSPTTRLQLLALLASTAAEVAQKEDQAGVTFEAVRTEVNSFSGRSEDERLQNFFAALDDARGKAATNAGRVDVYATATGRGLSGTTRQALVWLLDVVPEAVDGVDASSARATQLASALGRGISYDFLGRFQKNLSRFNRCAADRSNNLLTIQIEAAWLTDTLKDERADGGYPGYTRAVTVSAIGYMPLGRVLPFVGRNGRVGWHWKEDVPTWARFIELGTGVGTIGLSGTTIEYADQWRLTLPMRVRVLPSEIFWSLAECGSKTTNHRSSRVPTAASKADRIRRMLQSLQYHYGADLIFGRINSGVYSDLGPSTETLKNEIVNSHGLTFDVGTLIRGISGS